MTASPFGLLRAGLLRAGLLCTLMFSTLLWVSSAAAVGLGELRSDTRLGYPLRVEIPIRTGGAIMTADEIKASLMNEQEAAKRGVELMTPRHGFNVTVEEQGKQLMVVITTATAVKEPVLHWMIRLEWPKGSLAREYTLLLDI